MKPEFIVYCGPMMSSKTTSLLASVERYKYQGRHVCAFKPLIDDRYSKTEIVSHIGWKMPATQVVDGKELLQKFHEQIKFGESSTETVCAVDELFMIPGVANELLWLYKQGVTVIASTLDLSSSCEPFEEVVNILPFATQVHKCVAVCAVCRADAHYTWRKQSVDADEKITIGGAELYEPRCVRCHPGMM